MVKTKAVKQPRAVKPRGKKVRIGFSFKVKSNIAQKMSAHLLHKK